MSIGIYAIHNTITGKKYIGKSENIEKRTSEHISCLKRNTHRNTHLQSSYNKYGITAFGILVLEECHLSDLNQREIHWIRFYRTTDKRYGYNMTHGGTGGRLIPEALERMAQSLKGRSPSEASRKKQSETAKMRKINQGKKNGMHGRTPWNKGRTAESDPVLKAMGEKVSRRFREQGHPSLGKKRTIEQRIRMSESFRGIPKSEEHRRKLSEALTGKKLPRDVVEKIADKLRGRKHKEVTCPHCNKVGGFVAMERWHFERCPSNPRVALRDPVPVPKGSPAQPSLPRRIRVFSDADRERVRLSSQRSWDERMGVEKATELRKKVSKPWVEKFGEDVARELVSKAKRTNIEKYGQARAEEIKLKMQLAGTGVRRSSEVRAKIQESKLGKKNPAYKPVSPVTAAGILEKHSSGMSIYKIARFFGLTAYLVGRVLRETYATQDKQ